MTKLFYFPILKIRVCCLRNKTIESGTVINFMTLSPEYEVKENGKTNCDKNTNDPVHVFPAAHLHFDILGGLFHDDRLFLK